MRGRVVVQGSWEQQRVSESRWGCCGRLRGLGKGLCEKSSCWRGRVRLSVRAGFLRLQFERFRDFIVFGKKYIIFLVTLLPARLRFCRPGIDRCKASKLLFEALRDYKKLLYIFNYEILQ